MFDCQGLSNVDKKNLNNLQSMCILGNVVIMFINPFTTILLANVIEFDGKEILKDIVDKNLKLIS